MGFYDIPRQERKKLVNTMEKAIMHDLKSEVIEKIRRYARSDDTYIRKNAYLILGRLYNNNKKLRKTIVKVLERLFHDKNERARQTSVYAFGEIGKKDTDKAFQIFESALIDEHHSVRNAVVGSLKQMGEKSPIPTLTFARKFLHHPEPQIRAAIVHGIELRGRTHPEDILPLLAELQSDKDRTVRKKLIHVLSQISYKKGCLEKVVSTLKKWENKDLVEEALEEILDVHKRYEKFSAKTYDETKKYIEQQFYKHR